jgi:hypothetical protein
MRNGYWNEKKCAFAGMLTILKLNRLPKAKKRGRAIKPHLLIDISMSRD